MEIKNLKKRKEVKHTESPIESILFCWLRNYRVPFEIQYEIPPYRVDFFIPDLNLVIECDGKDFHSSEEQKERDEKRDNFLKSKGYKVKRYSGSEIYNDANEIPKELISMLYPKRIVLSEDQKEIEFMKLKTDTIRKLTYGK